MQGWTSPHTVKLDDQAAAIELLPSPPARKDGTKAGGRARRGRGGRRGGRIRLCEGVSGRPTRRLCNRRYRRIGRNVAKKEDPATRGGIATLRWPGLVTGWRGQGQCMPDIPWLPQNSEIQTHADDLQALLHQDDEAGPGGRPGQLA